MGPILLGETKPEVISNGFRYDVLLIIDIMKYLRYKCQNYQKTDTNIHMNPRV